MLFASYRGPIEYNLDDSGSLISQNAPGGITAIIDHAARRHHAKWLAAAVTPADQLAVASGAVASGTAYDRRLIPIDDEVHVANHRLCTASLWLLLHGLSDLGDGFQADTAWHDLWAAYREVNQHFAEAIADWADRGEVVAVNDYHLALVAGHLARLRPDVRVVQFIHPPFAEPADFRRLPDGVRTALVGSLTSAPCGFNCAPWEASYVASMADHGRAARSFWQPTGPDPSMLRAEAEAPEVIERAARLRDDLRGRRLVLRLERGDTTKNGVRACRAIEQLLTSRPELCRELHFVITSIATRQGIDIYRSYQDRVRDEVDRLNDRFGADGAVVELHEDFDRARSLAYLLLYDVLVVASVRDGMPIVALEGPILNPDGVVVLSRETGSYRAMPDGCVPVNPWDSLSMAEAMATAVEMDASTRSLLTKHALEAVRQSEPAAWMAALTGAAGADR